MLIYLGLMVFHLKQIQAYRPTFEPTPLTQLPPNLPPPTVSTPKTLVVPWIGPS